MDYDKGIYKAEGRIFKGQENVQSACLVDLWLNKLDSPTPHRIAGCTSGDPKLKNPSVGT